MRQPGCDASSAGANHHVAYRHGDDNRSDRHIRSDGGSTEGSSNGRSHVVD
jgi:hypothetical protein